MKAASHLHSRQHSVARITNRLSYRPVLGLARLASVDCYPTAVSGQRKSDVQNEFYNRSIIDFKNL